MSIAVLELNDQALLIKTQGGDIYSEPGFALHSKKGLLTGNEARNQAWLQPQNVHRQYWRNLNQTRLPGDLRWARHNADIAFAQLNSLLTNAGSPEQLIISVAASFDDQQLSLLLGLLSAIPTQVIAVVDSGLADCLSLADSLSASDSLSATDSQNSSDNRPSRKTLHIDLHLYQSVVSQVSFSGDSVQISAQRVLPELGAMQIYSVLANHIRDRLVKSFRFDPMDAPEGEQAIYDLLPEWISTLGQQAEISLSVPSPRGDLPLILHKQEVLDLMAARLQGLASMLREFADQDITFASNARMVAILTDEFHSSRHLRQTQGVDNCFRFIEQLSGDNQTLHRITAIHSLPPDRRAPQPKTTAPKTTAPQAPGTATHLLHDGQAWPLNRPLGITIHSGSVDLCPGLSDRATLVLKVEQDHLRVLHQAPDTSLELPQLALCGAEIYINAYRFELIEVCDG
jgi:hypothetical protein